MSAHEPTQRVIPIGRGRAAPLDANSPQILMIGGDSTVAAATRAALESDYLVIHAQLGAEGIEDASERRPALVILCLALPDMDGLAVCRAVRSQFPNPILAMSSQLDEDILIAALDSGADDFLAKPFRVDELRARIRALLRRSSPLQPAEELIECGDLRIEVPRRRVLIGGKPAPLTRTEFDILLFLALRPNRIQPQERILQAVWGPHHGEYVQTLRVHIGHIRRKLESEPSRPEYVLTEPGVGYYFSCPGAAEAS